MQKNDCLDVLISCLERIKTKTDTMGAEFAQEVVRYPSYSQPSLRFEEVSNLAERVLAKLIDFIIEYVEKGVVDLGSFPSYIAQNRIFSSITLEDLVDAMRLDFSILWKNITSVANPDELPLLAFTVNEVWHVVELFVQQTRDEFTKLLFQYRNEKSISIQHHIAKLFTHPKILETESYVLEVARSLKIDVSNQFSLGVTSTEAFTIVHNLEKKLKALKIKFFFWDRGEDIVFFWPLTPRMSNFDERSLLLQELYDFGYAFVPDVPNIVSLHKAADIAKYIISAIDKPFKGVKTMKDVWPLVAAKQLRNIDLHSFDITNDLIVLSPDSRVRLLDTVRSYLRTGSISETAKEMYAHRNTVMNRLNQFTNLTGLDITNPQDAALVLIKIQGI